LDQDRLDEIFTRQSENQELFSDFDTLSETEKQLLTERLLHHLYSEGYSLLENLNWKLNVLKRKPPILSNVHIEIIDMAKYIIALAILWGLTPEEFFEQFMLKSDVVEERFENEKTRLKGELILAVDIDGVIADWFGGLLLYAEQHFEREFHREMLDNHHISAVKAFDLTKADEEELKSGFIESGGYRSLLSLGGQESLCKAKSHGYKILLLTSRPERRHRRIHGDTIDWLHSSGYQYDLIFFGFNKTDVIAEEIEPGKITYLVEDRIDNAIAVAKHYPETTVLLINRPYNTNVTGDERYTNIKRVDNWEDIDHIILEEHKC
jgi:uncharacterized HAD superfamily protein